MDPLTRQLHDDFTREFRPLIDRLFADAAEVTRLGRAGRLAEAHPVMIHLMASAVAVHAAAIAWDGVVHVHFVLESLCEADAGRGVMVLAAVVFGRRLQTGGGDAAARHAHMTELLDAASLLAA